VGKHTPKRNNADLIQQVQAIKKNIENCSEYVIKYMQPYWDTYMSKYWNKARSLSVEDVKDIIETETFLPPMMDDLHKIAANDPEKTVDTILNDAFVYIREKLDSLVVHDSVQLVQISEKIEEIQNFFLNLF